MQAFEQNVCYFFWLSALYKQGSTDEKFKKIARALVGPTRDLVLDGCVVGPRVNHIPDKSGDGTSIEVGTYSGCRGGAEVQDYVITNGGHAWPGGMQYLDERLIGKTSKNIDATELIWRFFSNQSRQDAERAPGN